MKLVVMNYSECSISFYTLPKEIEQSEDVENWIEENTIHSICDIHYMTGEEIEVTNEYPIQLGKINKLKNK